MDGQLREIHDREEWDQLVDASPWGHPLQLWGWGEGKRESGWSPRRLSGSAGAAQVLVWPIPKLGKKVAYVPRGPVAEPGSVHATNLLAHVIEWAKGEGALYVRVEPAWRQGRFGKGWRRSRHQIQMNETYLLDLRRSEVELLAPMSHKHRQYIRKAERDGVSVRRVTDHDIGPMYAIYIETAKRAGFGIHPAEYYSRLHAELGEHSFLYYAVHSGRPVAFLWLAGAAKTAYELYGGVNEAGAEVRANYYLKWRAIADMKASGYEIYDFNGRVTEGVARFKEGFGPEEVDWVGTWDYPLNQVVYHAWEMLWPVAKPVGRWIRGRR
jgi:lipid II:glycine glycyltransferase (peptidoglycan interpeptide bridge formation enzyme)